MLQSGGIHREGRSFSVTWAEVEPQRGCLVLQKICLLVVVVCGLSMVGADLEAQDCNAGSGCASPNCVYCHFYSLSLQECRAVGSHAQCGCGWAEYYGDNFGNGCYGIGSCNYGPCNPLVGHGAAPGCSVWEPYERVRLFKMQDMTRPARLLSGGGERIIVGPRVTVFASPMLIGRPERRAPNGD